MDENETLLNRHSTRVRQLILRFEQLKKENEELYAMVDERDVEIKALKGKLAQAENDYKSLMMAKMIEITDGDMESAQKRLAKLIRDVNKCITLLSEK